MPSVSFLKTISLAIALLGACVALVSFAHGEENARKKKKTTGCNVATVKGKYGFLFRGTFPDAVKKVMVERTSIGYMDFDGKGKMKGVTVGKYANATGTSAVIEDLVNGVYSVSKSCELSFTVLVQQSNRTTIFRGFLEHDKHIQLIQMTPGVSATMDLQAMGKIGQAGCKGKTLVGKYVYAVAGNSSSYEYSYSYAGFDMYDGRGNVVATTFGNPDGAALATNAKMVIYPDPCFVAFDYSPEPQRYLGVIVNEGERYFYIRTDPGGYECATVVKAK